MDYKQSDGSTDLKEGANNMDSGSYPVSKEYFCSRCEKTMASYEKSEHDDWHFAKDLQDQEQGGSVAPETPAQVPPQVKPPDPKQASDSNNFQPPAYAPPSHPPPTSGASRERAIRHHTNPVIEAAKVRARDEVRFAFCFW